MMLWSTVSLEEVDGKIIQGEYIVKAFNLINVEDYYRDYFFLSKFEFLYSLNILRWGI